MSMLNMQLALDWPVRCIFNFNMICRTVGRMRMDDVCSFCAVGSPHASPPATPQMAASLATTPAATTIVLGACKILEESAYKILECECRGAVAARDARWSTL